MNLDQQELEVSAEVRRHYAARIEQDRLNSARLRDPAEQAKTAKRMAEAKEKAERQDAWALANFQRPTQEVVDSYAEREERLANRRIKIHAMRVEMENRIQQMIEEGKI